MRNSLLSGTIALAIFVVPFLLLISCTGNVDGGNLEGTKQWFKEEHDRRGLTFRHQSGHRAVPLLPEINGSGVAVADFNDDGWLDIYFVQSGSLYDDELEESRNELYFNLGNGHFSKAPLTHGAVDLGYGMGVAAGDYDNDGDVDLYITNVGANELLANNGDGKFRSVGIHAKVDDSGFGTSATFQDFDRDGFLDLFVANYVHWNRNSEVECYENGIRAYCPPSRYRAPATNRLYRNNGDGTFADVSDASGIAATAGHSFGVATADFDSDGLVDIYVANDRTPNQLLINQGNMRFLDLAQDFGAAADGYGMVKAGMGVATADYDHDGDFDLLVVNLVGETDTFFRNEGKHFSDVTSWMGLNSVSSRYTRWGVILQDFDNDGATDLYVANGGVYPVDLNSSDIYAEPNLLFCGGDDGTFRLVGSTQQEQKWLTHTSRGVAVGDLDRDGGLDLVVVNRDSEPYLLMNNTKRGNWVSLELRGQNNRIAHGATLSFKVGTQQRHAVVTRDGSFMSSSDPRIHIGLNESELIADVSVVWPNGEQEDFGEVRRNQFVTLTQGGGKTEANPTTNLSNDN